VSSGTSLGVLSVCKENKALHNKKTIQKLFDQQPFLNLKHQPSHYKMKYWKS
jgi:hypothetical protein